MKSFDEILSEAESNATPEFCEQLRKVVSGVECCNVLIPVLGGMKAGKSTLLARMLACGKDYLPPGVLEATARNVFINWGFAANRKVEHADGTETIVVEDAEWDGLVRGTSRTVHAGDRLAVDYPADVLLKGGVSFVDTPGNNTIDDDKAVETWAALGGAQLAAYCIRATSMLTKSDVNFLRTAERKLKNMVVVVTRIDEAGIVDALSAEAGELIEYARQRIVETLGIEPLKITAVASTIDGDASGIPNLANFITQTVTEQGHRLREERARLDLSALAERHLPDVENSLTLLAKAGEADAEETQRRLGELRGQLADKEMERENALRRLAVELDGRKTAVRSEVAHVAQQAFGRIKSRVEAIESADDLEASACGLMMSECEQVRGDIQALLCRERDDGPAILQNAAADFLQGIEEAATGAVGDSFKVALSEPDQYEVSASLREESQRLIAEGAEVSKAIDVLKQEIENDESALPELRQNLELVRQAAANIQYEPKYVENPMASQSGRAESVLAGLGEALDWMLLFTPIPSNKLKWLGKLKYGPKVAKVIKQTNKIVRAKNRLVKNCVKTLPVLGPLADMFSAESWLRKVGRVLDGSNRAPEMIEDPETRRAYEASMADSQEKQRAISIDIVRVESDMKGKCLEIERLKQQGAAAESARQEVECELRERTHALAALRNEARLVEGRAQLLQRAAAVFALSSDFLKPVVECIEREFAQAYTKMSQELLTRMNATMDAVRQQLLSFESYRGQNDGERQRQMERLRARAAFYQTLILEK